MEVVLVELRIISPIGPNQACEPIQPVIVGLGVAMTKGGPKRSPTINGNIISTESGGIWTQIEN